MSDETTNEYKLVQDKLEEMRPLFDRLDEDKGLYLLDEFKMRKLDDSGDEKDVANVTLNDPLLYIKKAIAITGSYQRQTIIEGKALTDKQTTKIEDFLPDIFYIVNEWLSKREVPSLDAFINEQACVRGAISGRCCIRLDNEGGIIPDILPLDRRWFPYEAGQNGFIWVAPIYSQSKTQIENEYPELSGVELKNTGNEVVDLWYPDRNIIFIEKKIAREQENPYGYPPFVQSICPIGTLLNIDGSIAHKGESILWPNRDLWKEKNEITTILKTLSRKALRGGLELQTNPNSPDRGKKPAESPYQEDVVIATETGGGFRPLPLNDIKNATRLLYSIVETCLQRGELTPLDYGTLAFPLSSVAIMNLLAARNDIFAPILSMIASFYQSLSRMVIDQCVGLGQEIRIGRPGSYNTYSPGDFEGEFSIQYNFSLLTKEGTAADASLARALRGVVSDDYIRREIIKVPNPDGMKFDLQAQQAEDTDEVLFLFNRGLSFLRQAEDMTGIEREIKELEAKTLMQRIKTILRQRQSLGQLSPIEGKREAPKAEDILPLLEKGGTGAKGTPKAEEIET